MSTDEDIEVRELKTKDAFTLAKILLSLSDEATEEITELVTQKQMEQESSDNVDKEDIVRNQTQLGLQMSITIFQILLDNAENQLVEWFADLTNMSKEEFEETRIDTPMIVIDEISEQQGFVNFLSKVSNLYKKMNESAEQLKEN